MANVHADRVRDGNNYEICLSGTAAATQTAPAQRRPYFKTLRINFKSRTVKGKNRLRNFIAQSLRFLQRTTIQAAWPFLTAPLSG